MLLTEYDEVKHFERVYRNAYNDGEINGKAEALFNLMNSLKLSFEQAVDILKIPTDEWAFYKKAVAEKGMM